jgi:glycosyltransferase involved in cell wall biosynthesis
MKVLHINTFDTGGAAKACIRLHQGLLAQSVDSKVLVLYRYGQQEHVYEFLPEYSNTLIKRVANSLSYRLNSLANRIKKRRNPTGTYSIPHSIYDILEHPLVKEADILHLHWVAKFLDYPSFFGKVNKPIVWTLHDMNPLLGGFHYETDMENIAESRKEKEKKLSEVKSKALSQTNYLSVVAPSRWLHQLSLHSIGLGRFANYCIPYGVDLTIYKPTNQILARAHFNLPSDKKIVLFIADSITDPRKGYSYFDEAIKKLALPDILLCTIGKGIITSDNVLHQHLGFISCEQQLALAYAAADIFVVASLEDNLPNTVLESLACGTPVVGFNIGGIPDMVIEGKTGLLVSPKNIAELAEKIHWLLSNDNERKRMGENARVYIKTHFTLDIQAIRYIDLYRSLVSAQY